MFEVRYYLTSTNMFYVLEIYFKHMKTLNLSLFHFEF